MAHWTAGYVADIDYTHGYYNELNPLRLKLAFLNSGLVYPNINTACELGYGQGLSINVHAAASTTHWFGTDFNPAQASFAQELMRSAGTNVKLYDDAFAEFISRSELPEFDFIALHGIWSWISDKNRKNLVDFLDRKLKVGGIVYISYNTLPGWASFVPMRQLLADHAKRFGSEGKGIKNRIDGAIEFAERLISTDPLFIRSNPQVAERIKNIRTQSRHYLAHEYFNQSWNPMPFSELSEWLAPAKLQYACSAHYLEHVEAINLTAQQSSLLSELSDVVFRESVRDMMVNQPFRRDYWVKGSRKLSLIEQRELLRDLDLVLVTNSKDIKMTVDGALGSASMSESIYNPLIEFMSDYKVKKMNEIEKVLTKSNVNFQQMIQAIMVLCGKGHLAIAQNSETSALVEKSCDALNAYIYGRSRADNEINFAASPITGGGVGVGRFSQLFLLANRHGFNKQNEAISFVWNILSIQGQKLIKEGQTLKTDDENLNQLKNEWISFISHDKPILDALGIK